jgi:protein involved in ribonucleotide reduction
MPRVTLKAINNELARLGYSARLASGNGYFYFHFGEAADWLDRTVDVPTAGSHTLREWTEEFHRLKKLNEQITGKSMARNTKGKRRPGSA